jgi:hypothetical protein
MGSWQVGGVRRGDHRTVTRKRNKPQVSLSWDLQDAEIIADLFEREGRRLNDRGFLDDAASMRQQFDNYTDQEKAEGND